MNLLRLSLVVILICYCSRSTIQQLNPEESVNWINLYRSTPDPPAARMTCLTWDTKIASTLNSLASRCSVPFGKNIAFDVSDVNEPVDMGNIFLGWWSDGENYFNYVNNCCNCPGIKARFGNCSDNCQNYKAIMNDQANSFACVQKTCTSATAACRTLGSGKDCYLTWCQFNVPTPTKQPYVQWRSGCNQTSCNLASDVSKTECMENGLCCSSTTPIVNSNEGESCPDGKDAMGSCVGGQCGSSDVICTAADVCCQKPRNLCGAAKEAGYCVKGLCGEDYTCNQKWNVCCYNRSAPPLCNEDSSKTNWWCATKSAEGRRVPSAFQANSCFCVAYKNQTQQQAADYCQSIGGFLSDIQNEEENNLIKSLLERADKSDDSAKILCPSGSVPFRGVCYVFVKKYKNWQNAEQYCQTTYRGHLASIHSNAEHEFLFKSWSQNCSNCSMIGFWLGGNKYGTPNSWVWSDNTDYDFIPQKTYFPFISSIERDENPSDCMFFNNKSGCDELYCQYLIPFACSFMPSRQNQNSWIGLQKVVSGNVWNIGGNCQTIKANYQQLSTSPQTGDQTSYVYTPSGTWSAVSASSTANSAICRQDRNICGRELCPACAMCQASDSGNCYTCD